MKKKMQNPGYLFLGIGFELVILVLGASYVGPKLDEVYHLNGWGSRIAYAAVSISWLFHIVLLTKKYLLYLEQEEQEQNESSQN